MQKMLLTNGHVPEVFPYITVRTSINVDLLRNSVLYLLVTTEYCYYCTKSSLFL